MQHSRADENVIALSDGLDRQIGAMEALRALLEEEYRALQSRDPEQLLAVTRRKTDCIGKAAQIGLKCRELEAREATLTSTDRTGAVCRQRERLDTLTRLCRDLNHVNGTLIRRQKIRVEKTLQIMRGEPDQPRLYGPSGNTADGTSTRRILASI